MKIKLIAGGGQIFYCPGCKGPHALNTKSGGPSWNYNNNPDNPTFTPSILVTVRWSKDDPKETDEICHSFVTDGKIQFLGDCTHELAGQTIELPEYPYP